MKVVHEFSPAASHSKVHAGVVLANGSKVSLDDASAKEMLRAQVNVRYVGCDRSIRILRPKSAMGRSHLDRIWD